MPSITDADLSQLRQIYSVAYSAHQSCVLALNAAALRGIPPSSELKQNEAAALREMTDARRHFFAGLAESATDYECRQGALTLGRLKANSLA